jgi:hypothetical protein
MRRRWYSCTIWVTRTDFGNLSAKCAKVDENAFGKAAKQAAELVGASSRYFEMAKRILEEAPDLIPLIFSDAPNDDGTPKMTIPADIWASRCRTCEML